MKANAARAAIALGVTLGLAGCFYPPLTAPPGGAESQARLTLPYDLAWDAVHAVIKQNGYHVRAEDPNHGIIEAQGTVFTLQDADCGEVRNLGGRFSIDPGNASSAEYNFHVKAEGPEAAIVAVEATFVAPLNLPFRPPSNVECVSRGVNEARLLGAIGQQAALEHRPVYRKTP
jgi:hypothetical protein